MYEDLADEEKLVEAINFVARGAPIPAPLADWLKEQGLYEAITVPVHE